MTVKGPSLYYADFIYIFYISFFSDSTAASKYFRIYVIRNCSKDLYSGSLTEPCIISWVAITCGSQHKIKLCAQDVATIQSNQGSVRDLVRDLFKGLYRPASFNVGVKPYSSKGCCDYGR